MLKKLAVTITSAAILSTALVSPALALAPQKSTALMAQLSQTVPDGTAKIPGVPKEFTLVAESYYVYEGRCAVERTYVWSDEYGYFRHHRKAYWC